ncbi:MAG: S-layer homology domain-containing protein [Candidatus Abawacabacteria bacterium]|nr:S-layer homology domain-containing protein [Candidatus Abawacabacteria bacterium]
MLGWVRIIVAMRKSVIGLLWVLAFSWFVPVSWAANFPDVPPSHSFYRQIQFLKDRQVVHGFADGTFKPEQSITRGEFLKMLMGIVGYTNLPLVTENPFPDVPKNEPLAPYIKRAADLAIVQGYDDGLFRMNRSVNRVEALKLLLLVNRILPAQLPQRPNFSDVNSNLWYYPFASYAWEHHLFAVPANTMLKPGEFMNRALVADLLYRFYQDRPDLLPVIPTAPLPTSSTTTNNTSLPSPSPSLGTNSSAPANNARLISAIRLDIAPTSFTSPCPTNIDALVTVAVMSTTSGGTVRYRLLDNGVPATAETTITIPVGMVETNFTIPVRYASTLGVGLHVFNLEVLAPVRMISEAKTMNFVCHNSITNTELTIAPNTIFQCGRDNMYTVSMGLSLDGSGSEGTVKYYWQHNDGRRVGPFEATYGAGETQMNIPDYQWTIAHAAANGEYSLLFFAILPNNMSSTPITVTKSCH